MWSKATALANKLGLIGPHEMELSKKRVNVRPPRKRQRMV